MIIGRPTDSYSGEAGGGKVAEVMCFDRALTTTEMEEIYDNIFA